LTRWPDVPTVVITGTNDTSLPVRLDAPVVYKENVNAMLDAIRSAIGSKNGDSTTESTRRRVSRPQ
jgi:hypothetical protein